MAVAVAVREKPEPLQRQLTWWALAFPLIMLVALARHDVGC